MSTNPLTLFVLSKRRDCCCVCCCWIRFGTSSSLRQLVRQILRFCRLLGRVCNSIGDSERRSRCLSLVRLTVSVYSFNWELELLCFFSTTGVSITEAPCFQAGLSVGTSSSELKPRGESSVGCEVPGFGWDFSCLKRWIAFCRVQASTLTGISYGARAGKSGQRFQSG